MNAKERREMNEPSGSGASERKGGRTAWLNTCHGIGWFFAVYCHAADATR